jgi:hypothetical protein
VLHEQPEGGGHVVWTASMSSYMLSYLAGLVGTDLRTSSGFNKVHLNACARALNDYFRMKLKYNLVDAGYGAKPGFLPPFRAVRYHLNEFG